MRVLATLSMIGLLATGCYYDNEEELYGPGCDTSVFGFSAKIMPILQANCQATACHGAGQAGNNGELLTYDQIKATVDNGTFRDDLFVTKRMPKDASLTACELDLIEKWLNAGAPND